MQQNLGIIKMHGIINALSLILEYYSYILAMATDNSNPSPSALSSYLLG